MTDLHDGADLRERIDRALADLHAPAGMTESVLVEGHRLRRRRRVLTGGSGLAAAAIIAALVVPSLGGGTSGAGPEIATEPPAPSQAAPSPSADGQTPSHAPDGGSPFPDPPAGWWDLPADELLSQLRTALPRSVEVTDFQLAPSDRAPGEPDVSPGWLHATLTGPSGPGGFEIILYSPALKVTPDPVSSTDANGDEHTSVYATGPSNRSETRCGRRTPTTDTCEEILDAEGRPVGRVTSNLQDGTITFHEVSLLGPDGGRVYMSAWNATDGKPGPDTLQSASVPPLTLDQLKDLARDPAWTSDRP